MLLRGRSKNRESGILLHISSLPSPYGIGSLGKEAYRFVDFLKQSGQTYWQILPLCPIGEGNSPYKSPSCFAGEILFIDIDFLVRDGLLLPEEIPEFKSSETVDYDAVRSFKLPLLKAAVRRFDTKSSAYRRFDKQNEAWLNDYALFMAICEENGNTELSRIEEGLRYRIPVAMESFRASHKKQIRFFKVTQFLFYSQFFSLKRYAEESGIKLIGDIPFYVSEKSADVWKNPDNFKLGRDLTPIRVAGVPPDVFSSTGQLWGNPVYDWDYQRRTNFSWWKRRIAYSLSLYNVLRIDHFRAFARYYTVAAGAANAFEGAWERGVGLEFWLKMKSELGKMNIIAEDLGGEEDEVQKLIADTEFPNMKVLQMAFNTDLKNPFLPKNYPKNCVCYTGTHDNDTALGWYNGASKKERIFFDKTSSDNTLPVSHQMILMAMHSRARLVIIPLQDWLCLDSSARMNRPGTRDGNWEWRVPDGALSDELSATVRRLSLGRNSNRSRK